ncbi:DivIVA domain-containing protein [Micromonospora zhanjiangensis]|uniref:DivIVA domain-containing protein n=1 Tax=Micromonospora zhanjiangensis TaxID=1522057 RepID=A0ABV8KMY5_9ACTN
MNRRGGGPGDRSRRLTSAQVRNRRFRARGFLRGGLDPADVYGFLHQVGDEIDLLRREHAALHAENERIKVALHHWQTWHRHCDIPDLHWPISHESGDRR